MAPEREILDSEDDGSDFSPVKAPASDGAHMYSREIHDHDREADHKPLDDTTTASDSSLKSTDPVFFQRVYDEQRAAASMQYDPLHPDPDPIPDPPSHVDQGTGTSSLNPLTDPATPGRKPKRTGASMTKEVAGVTQITTPSGKPGSRISDPWDVPSSPPPLPATVNQTSFAKPSKTYGKRKLNSQQSPNTFRDEMPPTQDPYAFPSTADQEPAPRARKRTKRAAESSMAEQDHEYSSSVDLPLTEDGSIFTRQPSKRASLKDASSGSVIPDTYGAGLYITPSALTASQKQQYQLVSLSSEPGPEPSLPAAFSDATQIQKSSCASTIAYPTPSRYAGGSFERIDDVPSTEAVDVLPTIPEPIMMDLPSSPDVIGAEPQRPKRSRPQSKSVDGPSSSETRTAKKKRTARPAKEDLPDSEPWTPKPVKRMEKEAVQDETLQAGNGSERHTLNDPSPQGSSGPRRTGRTTRPSAKLAEATSPLASTLDPLAYEDHVPEITPQAVEESPPKKKRGRKKKEVAPKEPVPDEMTEEPLVEEPKEPEAKMDITNAAETQDIDPPKRKRGRPRKSAAAPPIVIDLDSEPDVPAVPVDESPPQVEAEPTEEPPPKPTAAPKAKPAGKRGRKKKQDTIAAKSIKFVPPEEEQDEEETKPASALSEISENTSRPVAKEIPASDDEGDDHDGKQEEKEEADVKSVAEEKTPVKAALAKDPSVKKEAVKPTVASSASKGKVPYRVGLSKRSRIAPLLKSLRK